MSDPLHLPPPSRRRLGAISLLAMTGLLSVGDMRPHRHVTVPTINPNQAQHDAENLAAAQAKRDRKLARKR